MLLTGEAGIGKSRLSAALMEAIAAEPHTRLRYFCSPQHTDSAFYPLIGRFTHFGTRDFLGEVRSDRGSLLRLILIHIKNSLARHVNQPLGAAPFLWRRANGYAKQYPLLYKLGQGALSTKWTQR